MKKINAKMIAIIVLCIALCCIWGINGSLNITKLLGLIVLSVVALILVFLIDNCLAKKLDKKLNNNLKEFWSNTKVIEWLSFIAIIALSIFVRVMCLNFETEDYTYYFSAWVNQYRSIGIHALGCNIGDYSPLYATPIIFISVLLPNVPNTIVVKIIPIIFDYALSFVGVQIFKETKEKSSVFERIIVFSALIFNPLIILNSSVWGQCDTVYTALILLCILFIIKYEKKKIRSIELIVIIYSIAFAYKFQSVLFLPFLLFYLLYKVNILKALVNLLWIPLVYLLTSIPMLIEGRALSDIIGIYAGQTGEYLNKLTMRYFNFYTLLGDTNNDQTAYFWIGLILGIVVIALVYASLLKSGSIMTLESLILTALITVFTLAYFLPSMHERYAIVGEMLILLLAFSKRKYILYAFAEIICTLMAYGEYLSANAYTISYPIAILTSITRLTLIVFMVIRLAKCMRLFSNSKAPDSV
ncbi:MAG: hypothetical protein IJ195_05720 [Lachnospiraceae bacterium]|nr:hypothetical protein [Lachnospiraceae bacterium]